MALQYFFATRCREMAVPMVVALTKSPMHSLHDAQSSMTCLKHSGKIYSSVLDYNSVCDPHSVLFACDIPDDVSGEGAKEIALQHAIPLFATIFPPSDSK